MAKQVFSDGIDYQRVRIYRGIPYLPDTKVAVSPNGHIYFPRRSCPDDFALAGDNYQMWLVHELTHVWQYQHGFKTWWAGLLLMASGGYFNRKAYTYPRLELITCFGKLNMEQQADLLAHYYAARYLKLPFYNSRLAAFQTALAPFLSDCRQKNLLPRYCFCHFFAGRF